MVGETANGLKQADAEPSANSEAMTGVSPGESSQQADVQTAAVSSSQSSSIDSGSGRMYRMLYDVIQSCLAEIVTLLHRVS